MAANDSHIDFEAAEALGISRQAYDETVAILGHLPSMAELSTLLAMWESNGRQQSLYGWLKGQHHSMVLDEYLYTGSADHRAIQEPRTKECLDIAHQLCPTLSPLPQPFSLTTGLLLYMVGNISTEFADSEYAQRCLHLAPSAPSSAPVQIDTSYVAMITQALYSAGLLLGQCPVTHGGLFCSLLGLTSPLGFDILCPREVRLDAFLFGEEHGRYIVALDEAHDDTFLAKLTEARLNCCFLGRTTKNRIVVDGYDFGPVADFASAPADRRQP